MIISKKTFFLVLGVTLIVIGVVGIFLPILQGLLIIFAGLFLIGEYKNIKIVDDITTYIKKLKK